MASPAALVIRKAFTYQGATREYDNKYVLLGDGPSDFAAWAEFASNVIDLEKTIFPVSTHIVKATGYEVDNDVPVYTSDFTTAGTLSVSGASSAPGDCAAIVKYTTNEVGVNHHRIYGFSYYHGAVDYDSGSGHPDGLLYIPQREAMETYATAWMDGISDGAVDHARSTPKQGTVVEVSVDQWIRHRDFPG